MKKIDTIIGILGVIVAIAIYIAQESHTSPPWNYVLVAFPILLTIIIIGAVRLSRKLKYATTALAELRKQYDLIIGTKISSTVVVRILNENGDIQYRREFRYELIKDTTVAYTKRDLIGSEVELAEMPPIPRIIKCSNDKVKLLPVESSMDKGVREGREHYDYGWSYNLSAPLRGKGEFLEYEYAAEIPKSEKTAFSSEGGIFFFNHEVVLMSMRCVLISPPSYRIEIIAFRVVGPDGKTLSVPQGHTPAIRDGGNSLEWEPAFIEGTSICHYRLVRA